MNTLQERGRRIKGCYETTCYSPRVYHIEPPGPNIDAILARLPLPVIEQLMDVLAGKHHTPEASVNTTRCMQAVVAHITPREQFAVYEWAMEVQSDLQAVDAGEHPNTPYTEVLDDCLSGISSVQRTAELVQAIAVGLAHPGTGRDALEN